MKVLVVLAAVMQLTLAVPFYLPPDDELLTLDIGPNMTYFLVEDEERPGQYVVEDLVNAEVDIRASGSDLTYYYYSKKDADQGTAIKSDKLDVLKNTDFTPSRETLFIIHGWKNSYKSDVNVLIKKAALTKNDINIFVVDWSPIANRNYISAKGAVKDVGNFVAGFIQALKGLYKLDLSKVSIAGHSLGAHVSGNAGAALNSQIPRILGMDPALPLFSIGNTDNRLDPSDAKFVSVIHTCGGMLGFFAPIGHADYYPNGGKSQAGCGFDITGSCAHARSYIYYAESVNPPSKAFTSKQCSSYKDWNSGKCDNNPKSDMGRYPVDSGARGLYYLNTNSKAPFAQG